MDETDQEEEMERHAVTKSPGQKGLISRAIARWDVMEIWVSGIIMCFALILTFYSVCARYIFHWSLDWSDEISVYAVVWSVFLGISSLVKKDEHVRVDLFIDKFSDKRKNILHIYHTLLGLLFVFAMIYGGYLFVQKAYSANITSESYLKFPMWIPYLIMPIGSILLALRMGERLVMLGGLLSGKKAWKDPVVPIIIAGSLVLYYILTTGINVTGALVILLLTMLFSGMPVGFAMGITSLACLLYFSLIKMDGVAPKMFWSINKLPLIAIPYFIVAGNLMMKGGLAKPLLEFGYAFLKRIDGGLAIAVMFAAVIFSAISGVSAALAATLGLIAIPWMMEKGYPKRFCMGSDRGRRNPGYIDSPFNDPDHLWSGLGGVDLRPLHRRISARLHPGCRDLHRSLVHLPSQGIRPAGCG